MARATFLAVGKRSTMAESGSSWNFLAWSI